MAIPVQSVTLKADKSSFYPRKTIKITATVLPKNATDKTVKFTVSSKDFSITSAGDLSLSASATPANFIGKGDITVTVTGTSTNGKKGTVKVTLLNPFTNYYAETIEGQDFLGWEAQDHTIYTYGGAAPGGTTISSVFAPHQKIPNPDSYTIVADGSVNGTDIQYELLDSFNEVFATASFTDSEVRYTFNVNGYLSESGTPVFGGSAMLLPLLTPFRPDAIRAGSSHFFGDKFYVGSVNLPITVTADDESYSVIFDKTTKLCAFFPWQDGEEYFTSGDLSMEVSKMSQLFSSHIIPVDWAQPFTIDGDTWYIDTDNIKFNASEYHCIVTIPVIKRATTVETTVTYNSQKIIDSLEVTPPVTVAYNGSTIATLNEGDTKTLQCSGKVMASDVTIGGKTLQCNGKLMASDVAVEVEGNANE